MTVTATTPIVLGKKSQEGIISFHKQAYQMLNQQWNIRDSMRQIDLRYMREFDWTVEHQRAKLSNKYGDSTKFQNITVPVVLPTVESAVTYQSSVFLTGTPIFGVVAAPEFEDEAVAMTALIDDQATRGGWTRQLMLFFRDGFKYNLSAIEVDWTRETTASMETDLTFSATQAKPKETIWQGNRITRLDPYNTFFDSRVPIAEHYKSGEFGGYTKIMSRIELKVFINSLPDKIIENIVPAFESGMGGSTASTAGGIESYYVPQLNPDALFQRNPKATTDWMAWAGIVGSQSKIMYKNVYEVTTLYGRILPSEFNIRVPSPNTPQVWKFIIVNHSVLIYAERQTNAHGYIPILFGQPLEDGLGYQTKSLASNVAPIQDISTALANSLIASRRRAISDRGLYDPSRVAEHKINSDNPSAKIPVRPAAYGKPLSEAYYPIPFRDDQVGTITQEISNFQRMADMISGNNPAKQGQFVKGNKTLHEYQDVMSHANGKDQMVSLLLESQVFTPMKEIIKINILQFQGGVSLFDRTTQQNVKIDPVALRKAVLNFKISDGLTPSDKLINSDTLTVAMQAISTSPALASEYNLAPLFSYLMKTQGADLKAFEKSPQQIAYEQAIQQWQQQVQVIAEQLKGLPAADAQKVLKSLPPQPTPQQFGYVPQKQGSSTQTPLPSVQVTNQVRNISTVHAGDAPTAGQ